MNSQPYTREGRTHVEENLNADLVVVGGGMAGVCCAITAAREGIDVILLQDRPVLGGNASSEVRLWILGATSHMGNNNRWAREGGVIDEILVENLWRNPEGNPIIFDALLLEKVVQEPRIRLLLNSVADSLTMADDGRIAAVHAYCSQNQTVSRISAPLFCDASGDGILGYLAGAAFRMGTEARAEFGELLADEEPGMSLLGHSLYFYARDTGKPVRFIPPPFALRNVSPILRYRELKVSETGCRLWWISYGGALDTIHDTEEIKWELWRVAYGIWNHIKNSGDYPEASTLTLEWMGMIPGKRESRRFEGDVMLCQQDLIEQRRHPDAVSFGGWAVDLHPPEGVYSPAPPCTQWHAKGVYQIPYRAMYSRDVSNLFLAGRLISASHIAFGSTRVMATCAHNGQAVGMAAVFCKEQNVLPRDLAQEPRIGQLQQRLLRAGQYIPGLAASDQNDLARVAQITASSTLALAKTAPNGEMLQLDHAWALLLPLQPAPFPSLTVTAEAAEHTALLAEIWKSAKPGNFTPEILLSSASVELSPGKREQATLHFNGEVTEPGYVFLTFPSNPQLSIALTDTRIPGILTLHHSVNAAVARSAVQLPPLNSGIESFAFWLPRRRPKARDIAVTIDPPLRAFDASQLTNGIGRPVNAVNGWVPGVEDRQPWLRFSWPQPQRIQSIQITFDTDYDHPMESVLMTHPECAMPACVRHFRLLSAEGTVLADVNEHHQSRWRLDLAEPLHTSAIVLEILKTWGGLPAIYEVRCY
jgi:FAD-dependent oxidoreductase family protein